MPLHIYEVFSSIQGESTYAGQLCFFIRLAGCNLRCGYCDTMKAQTPSTGMRKTIPELLDAAGNSGIRLVEITGGEPLLQSETPQLCSALLDAGFKVLVETNGSADCSVLPANVIRIIDYKTPSSGEADKMLPENFTNLRSTDEVKFVISDRTDYLFSLEIIKKYRIAAQTDKILFSPSFGTMDIKNLVAWMIEDRVPARLNLQLHKYIWGPDAEGV